MFAHVQEAGADEKGLEQVFVEHLADLGARRVEDVSLQCHFSRDEVVVLGDLVWYVCTFMFGISLAFFDAKDSIWVVGGVRRHFLERVQRRGRHLVQTKAANSFIPRCRPLIISPHYSCVVVVCKPVLSRYDFFVVQAIRQCAA